MNARLIWICLLALVFLISCSNSKESTNSLTISAAASLTDAMEEIVDIYEQSHDISITLNLASSGTLAQQIEQGAPADVYISANQSWMDKLEKKERIIPETKVHLVENNLVVIAQEGSAPLSSIEDIADLGENEQLALGQPGSVPAGTYTKQALEKIQLWNDLEQKMVYAHDVRQVLAYVESGNVTYGFVYGSDATTSDNVSVVSQIDTHLHDPIIYPAAIISDSENQSSAQSFLDFLQSDEAQSIWRKTGFQTN
ncbi:molybdate ABC transporter substrate-binding protein [Halobacillus locisalis]|uniref:Molybdate ABC transporter substrate-binding protein n=1 Tax=Halobacillus locisalis TaxID=220753 RepID=A0A838CRR4_9BACI|nr:molybdate ABC transporter substrate-binding protein [Halobacillus locisalis]MBA2174710.1 molybdate ABC transporter substrate-binding protein [Halobacillus locisalis]